MIAAATIATIGYLIFISLEISLSKILYAGHEARTSVTYVRNYRQMCHMMWFGMYVLFMFGAFKVVGSLELKFGMFGLCIMGLVRFIWIQEPPKSGDE